MKNSKNRIQYSNRQQQRMSRKTVVVIAAACMTCMTIGITIYFNISNVDPSMADNHNNNVSMYTVVDDEPVVAKTLDAPLIKQMPAIGPNTVLVRPVKTGGHSEQNNN